VDQQPSIAVLPFANMSRDPEDPIVVSSTASPIGSPRSFQKYENSAKGKKSAEIGQLT
jgi:hypothetical protein